MPEIPNVKTGNTSSEDIFLADAVRLKTKWTRIAKELHEKGNNNEMELAYADAFRVMINRFTNDQPPEIIKV